MLKQFIGTLCLGVCLGAQGQSSSNTIGNSKHTFSAPLAPGIHAGMLDKALDNTSATFNATTSFCLPVATPLVMNFPGPAGNQFTPAIPPCWTLKKNNGTAYVLATSSSKSPPNIFYFYNFSPTDSLFLISPPIVGLDSNNKQVRFWISSGSNSYGNEIIIGTVSSLTNPFNNFIALDSTTVLPGTTWKEFIVPIHTTLGYNGTDQFVAFLYKNSTSYRQVALDDITIENATTCIPPNAVTIDSITVNSATISWSSLNGQSFEIEIGTSGFTPGTGGLFYATGNQYTFTGLNANNSYHFYISDTCNTALKSGPHLIQTPCGILPGGNYTIGGPTGTVSFSTMSEALNTLQCGISGPIVFNLSAGSYPGYHLINPIQGGSDTNTITFNGAGSGLTIFTGNSSSKSTIEFNGTQHVALQNMTIYSGNTKPAIWMHNDAAFLQLENIDVIGDTIAQGYALISTNNTDNPQLIYGSGVNNISFKNLWMKGGNYSFLLVGNSTTSFSEDFILENITSVKAYTAAIYCRSIGNLSVNGSTATDFRGTSSHGINAEDISNWSFTNNYFESGASTIIIVEGNFPSQPAQNSIIANNILKSGNNGLSLSNSRYVDIFHNTLNGGYSSLYLVGCSFFNARNNILSTSAGRNITAANVVFSATSHLDYNLFDKGTGIIASINSTQYNSLPAFVAAIPSSNQHSLSGPAGFVSPNDFRIQLNSPAFNSGDNTVLIPLDFDGHPRPDTGTFLVDMGAHEYMPRSLDLEFQGLTVSSEKCGDSATTVGMIVKNLGLNTISTPVLSTQLTGGINQIVQTSPGLNIPFLGIDTIVVGTVNTSAGASNVLLNGSIQLPGDEDTTNNSGLAGPFRFVPQVPVIVFNDTLCSGQDSATIAALPINGVEYGWFANSTDLAPVATGNSFSFPASGQNTWYLDYLYVMDSLSTVPYSTNLGCNAGIMFDITAHQDISIFGMEVNSRKAAGTQATATIHIIPNGQSAVSGNNSAAWIIHEVVTFTSNGIGFPSSFVFQNPIHIPAGATYAIYVQYDAGYSDGNVEPTLFKNQDFTLTTASGHCNPFTPIAPRVFNGTIHYGTKACSEPKQPVTVFVDKDSALADVQWNNISLGTVSFSDGGNSYGTSYIWDFGDGSPLISTLAPSTNHTYFAVGLYTVTVIAQTACSSDTIVFQVPINSVGLQDGIGIQALAIFPNPTAGDLTIAFNSLTDGMIECTLYAMTGQALLHSSLTVVGYEDVQWNLELGHLPTGVYIVSLETPLGTIRRNVVVRP